MTSLMIGSISCRQAAPAPDRPRDAIGDPEQWFRGAEAVLQDQRRLGAPPAR